MRPQMTLGTCTEQPLKHCPATICCWDLPCAASPGMGWPHWMMWAGLWLDTRDKELVFKTRTCGWPGTWFSLSSMLPAWLTFALVGTSAWARWPLIDIWIPETQKSRDNGLTFPSLGAICSNRQSLRCSPQAGNCSPLLSPPQCQSHIQL